MTSQTKPRVEVVGREIRVEERVIETKVTNYGQRKVTRVVTETTEQPYVLLSCGHAVRGADFDWQGKNRKHVDCYQCARKEAECKKSSYDAFDRLNQGQAVKYLELARKLGMPIRPPLP